ncbi:MAG: SH3 domain-containing protein [Lachnospiraceae bacterium]
MMKHITNHRQFALAVAMTAVLALTGCGSVAGTETTVAETEAVVETEPVTENTEAYEPDTEFEATKTMTTETEADETGTGESKTESTEISETETAVIESETSPKAVTINYTFTDMSTTMYAKSSVNVRSLPSTDGTRLGSLTKNQAVTITGKCNETGWYRIIYNDGEAYVSDKYLSDNAIAESASISSAGKEVGASANANTEAASTDPDVAAAIAKFGPNIVVFDDGSICDAATWEMLGTVKNGQIVEAPTDGFNRDAAEEIWGYVNAERTAAGLNEIAWDEDIYNFACQRAQAIVTDYSHNGHGNYGENIDMYLGYSGDPYSIHMAWHNSTGHYNNYMNERYTIGACAVYIYNGIAYAVENFSRGSNSNNNNTTREVNGQIMDVTQAEAEAIDKGNIWIASNGVVICILDSGNLMAGDGVHTLEELQAAMDEYYSCH